MHLCRLVSLSSNCSGAVRAPNFPHLFLSLSLYFSLSLAHLGPAAREALAHPL